jgi:RNA polymerase sigma factor (sigma-70 family)
MSNDSITQSFLNEIGKHPLLTPEQEVMLGRKVQTMRELQETLTEGAVPSLAQKRILRQGTKARDHMIRANLRLVVNISKKYVRRVKHLTLLDLVQEGSLGLVRAVEMYDPARGYRFSTYAYWWIRQGITRAISVRETSIRMPHKLGEKLPLVSKTAHKLSQTLRREPTRNELAEELGICPDELAMMLVRCGTPASLEAGVGKDGSALIDLIIDRTAPDAYDSVEEDYSRLDYALSRLSERERTVMVMRHGLNAEENASLNRIAAELGVSRQMVQQVEQRSMRKLRLFMHHSKDLSNSELVADVVSNLDKEAHLCV